MPSGSKKRKAAKKKKENKSDNNHSNQSSASAHSHGGDDGEVSSPTSQDHHSNQNVLTEEEEEEIEEGEKISNPGVKIEVVDKPNIVVEKSVVPVEREFKIGDESNKKDEKFEHDEAPRKSCDGGSSGSSSSSSSSSDDEAHGIKSSQAVVDIAPVVDSVQVADSLSGGQAEVVHKAIIEEAGDSVAENIKTMPVGEKTEVDMSSLANNSVAASTADQSVFKENGDKKLSAVEEKVGISEAFKDESSQQEEAIISSVENIAAIPDPKECVAQETDDQLTVSYDAPRATPGNGADTEKEPRVTEPSLAPASRPVQTTSWKSCCGLFEVFTGSGR